MTKLDECIRKYTGIYTGSQKLSFKEGTGFRKGEMYGDGTEFLKKVVPFVDYAIKQKHPRAITILDYGCGRAVHTYMPKYNMLKLFKDTTIFEYFKGMIQCYYCYDPSVPRYNEKPTSGSLFDVVAIPDVLEHVPEEFVEDVIADSISFLKKDGLYVATISNNPSYACFTNSDGTPGDNLHCTLKPIQWWIDKFNKVIKDRTFVIAHNDHAAMSQAGYKSTVQFYHHNSQYFNFDKKYFGQYFWVS